MNGGPAEAEDDKKKERREARTRQMSPLLSSELRLHERPSFRFILRNMEPRVVTIRRGVIFGVMNKPGAGQRS